MSSLRNLKRHPIPGKPKTYIVFVCFREGESFLSIGQRLQAMAERDQCSLFVGNTVDLSGHFQLCKTMHVATCDKPVVAVEPRGNGLLRIFKTGEKTEELRPPNWKFPRRFRICCIIVEPSKEA